MPDLLISDPPYLRTIEGVIEAGRRAMLRSARENEAQQQIIEQAADWLLECSRELRESGGG